MKDFFFIITLVSGLSLGYMAIGGLIENSRLRSDIKSLEIVIDNQDKLLNNCNIY